MSFCGKSRLKFKFNELEIQNLQNRWSSYILFKSLNFQLSNELSAIKIGWHGAEFLVPRELGKSINIRFYSNFEPPYLNLGVAKKSKICFWWFWVLTNRFSRFEQNRRRLLNKSPFSGWVDMEWPIDSLVKALTYQNCITVFFYFTVWVVITTLDGFGVIW